MESLFCLFQETPHSARSGQEQLCPPTTVASHQPYHMPAIMDQEIRISTSLTLPCHTDASLATPGQGGDSHTASASSSMEQQHGEKDRLFS